MRLPDLEAVLQSRREAMVEKHGTRLSAMGGGGKGGGPPPKILFFPQAKIGFGRASQSRAKVTPFGSGGGGPAFCSIMRSF